MTQLDRLTNMSAKTLLYGFLGAIAVATTVTMMSSPFDSSIGDGSEDRTSVPDPSMHDETMG